MNELVNRAKANQARQSAETRGAVVGQKPLTVEEIENAKMMQKFEELGTIKALEELRDLTGDPKARVEVFRDHEEFYDGHDYDSIPCLKARLVWGEQTGPEVVMDALNTKIIEAPNNRNDFEGVAEVTRKKVKFIRAKSIEVTAHIKERLNGSHVAVLRTSGTPEGLADVFAKGGKEIVTGQISTGTVTRREKYTREPTVTPGMGW